jgi:hypothetical protein
LGGIGILYMRPDTYGKGVIETMGIGRTGIDGSGRET